MLRDKGIRGKKAHMHSQQNKEGILDSYSPRACLQVVTWSQRFLQPPSSAPHPVFPGPLAGALAGRGSLSGGARRAFFPDGSAPLRALPGWDW